MRLEEATSDSGQIVLWNIRGIKNTKDVWPFLEKYSVVILQETFVTKEKEQAVRAILSPEFVWWTKPAIKKHKAGRAAGGQLLGIRKSMASEWCVNVWSFGLKATKGTKENLIIILSV